MPDWSSAYSHSASSCTAGLENVTSVNDNRLAIDVLVGSNKEHTIAHVTIVTRTSGRNLALEILLWQLALLILTTLALGHLTWEHTRSDAVDTDLQLIAGNLPSKHLCQVNDGGLACVVGKVMLGSLDDTRNGTSVDDTARVALVVLRCGLEKRQKGRGHEEALRDAEQAVNIDRYVS